MRTAQVSDDLVPKGSGKKKKSVGWAGAVHSLAAGLTAKSVRSK